MVRVAKVGSLDIPDHDIYLQQDPVSGNPQAVCVCGRYRSTPCLNRQQAYKLGRTHLTYIAQKRRSET